MLADYRHPSDIQSHTSGDRFDIDYYSDQPIPVPSQYPSTSMNRSLADFSRLLVLTGAASLSGGIANPREIENLANLALQQGAPHARIYSRRLSLSEARKLSKSIQERLSAEIRDDRLRHIHFWLDMELDNTDSPLMKL
tara:strand:+ start:747 stop:1163 length:417 start_codon:yes stop_codon:yes gene_type:complete